MPSSARRASRLPGGALLELLVAQLEPGPRERRFRMRLRQARGHVHVVDAGLERAIEDGHDELWIDRVHDQVDAMVLGDVRDALRGRGIDLMRLEFAAVIDRVDDVLRPVQVVVRHEHVLEPTTVGCDLGNRLADCACANKQDSHQSAILAMTCLMIV